MCLCWQQSCYNFFRMERRQKRAATPAKYQGPGRPRVHSEKWAKVSVVLFERQIHHLDRLSRKARRNGHKSITRACLIRGLIDGMIKSGLDLSAHPSELQVSEDVAARLRTSRPL
jgi:hypothetical protein